MAGLSGGHPPGEVSGLDEGPGVPLGRTDRAPRAGARGDEEGGDPAAVGQQASDPLGQLELSGAVFLADRLEGR